MAPKLSIVIPVFNEAKTVRQLLDLVWLQEIPGVQKELVIVESNSTDGSRQVVQAFVTEKMAATPPSQRLKLILQDRPRGKGHAVRMGLLEATGDLVLIQDADLEYHVGDYPALIEPILRNQSNFVLGSRHMSAGSWKIRKFGANRIRSRIMNLGGAFIPCVF